MKIIYTLFFLASLIQGQTLQNSVDDALSNDPTILENLTTYKETLKDLDISHTEYLPTIDFVSNIGYQRTGYENSHIIDQNAENRFYYENSLTLLWNIFDGFSTESKVNYQRSKVIASAYNFVEKADSIAFDITKAHIQFMKHQELLITAKENVQITEDIFKKINELYENGITTKSEVRKIESSLFLARSNFIVQKNNSMDAMFNYKKLSSKQLDFKNIELPKIDVELPKSLIEATEYALKYNPTIMVSNYNIQAAKDLKKQKSKNFYPKIDFIFQQNIDKYDHYNDTQNNSAYNQERNRLRAGVTLSYNLYRGGADDLEVKKSQDTITRNIHVKVAQEKEIVEGLELSWAAYSMTKEQLVELSKYQEYSKETLSLYKEEYNLGRRSLLDLLSVQNDFINAKAQIIVTKYDNLFAKYRILDSMGLLVSSIMGDNYRNQVGLDRSKLTK